MMLAELLITLFFLLVDVFIVVSIFSFLNLCLYTWIYERDTFDYEEDTEDD